MKIGPWYSIEMLVQCGEGRAFCGGTKGVRKYSMPRAEESVAMWLIVAQLQSNHLSLMKVHD